MSMLAEPRRKQKVINLRAKNNAWSNDTNKFGQRMLEKMGWSSGKGLGAKENGIVEHVVARYKNDDRGLGYEDKNDQWTKTEDDFNALLANLSGSGNELQLHSGVSLENKSKKSKARIHYHKFTRGKDLSRYSEKDLANIFGKKSFKKVEPKSEKIKEEIKATEQVFTEKGSMEDYFKSKLAAFKSKSSLTKTENTDDNNCEFAFQGFSQTNEDSGDGHQGFGFQPFSGCTETEEEKYNTKKSKNRKHKELLDNEDLKIKSEHLEIEQLNNETKKSKKETLSLSVIDDQTLPEEGVIKTKKNKKKKRKHGTDEPSVELGDRSSIECNEIINNKEYADQNTDKKVKLSKKAKKHQDLNLDIKASDSLKIKKKKGIEESSLDASKIISEEEPIKKKKKKRSKDCENK